MKTQHTHLVCEMRGLHSSDYGNYCRVSRKLYITTFHKIPTFLLTLLELKSCQSQYVVLEHYILDNGPNQNIILSYDYSLEHVSPRRTL
jgi:hypothetical protein